MGNFCYSSIKCPTCAIENKHSKYFYIDVINNDPKLIGTITRYDKYGYKLSDETKNQEYTQYTCSYGHKFR